MELTHCVALWGVGLQEEQTLKKLMKKAMKTGLEE